MAGYGNRLALGDFPVLAEVTGKFCRGDFAHSASLSLRILRILRKMSRKALSRMSGDNGH
jgi:hypothetical protein